MFPNLSTLANICMTLPVSTVSVEQLFTTLKNCIQKNSLNHLMLQFIVIESPDELNDNKLDCIKCVLWNEDLE